jgi:nicotinamide-nucleotide amidase
MFAAEPLSTLHEKTPKIYLTFFRMTATALLTVGDEILLGEILDTNSQWLAGELSAAGLEITHRLSVGDDAGAITRAMNWLLEQCRLVVITGGLGPTSDDKTREVLAACFGMPLEENPLALADLEEKLRRRGREMNAMVRTQALHPRGAELIRNPLGTASGIWIEHDNRFVAALPGVPYEMKAMATTFLLPEIRKQFNPGWIAHRYIRTVGVPETRIALTLQNLEATLPGWLKLAYLPSGGQVKLRLTARAPEAVNLESELDRIHLKMAGMLGNWVYARTDTSLEEMVAASLHRRGLGLAIRDSLTGNRLLNGLRAVENHPLNLISGTAPTGSANLIDVAIEETAGDTGPQVRIDLRYPPGLGEPEEILLPAFPVPELNRNMASLQALKHILDRTESPGPDFAA